MFRLSRSPAQTSNRCLGKHITIWYLLLNANSITILHSYLEYYLNEWNMEKEWELLLHFLLSMQIHNVGGFFSVNQILLLGMHTRLLFTAMEIVCLHLQVDFVASIFLDVLCKPTKKSNKYKLKVRKLVNLLTVWSLELFKAIFHVSNYFWKSMPFECYLTSCFYFGEMEAF